MRSSLIILIALAAPSITAAQSMPTIPIVVAEAMNMEFSMFGKPTYFDGKTPTDWPAGLVPAGARVVGGGVVGIGGVGRIQTAVFAFRAGTNPAQVLGDLLRSNGYRTAADVPAEPTSGFVTTEMPTVDRKRFCSGPYVATFSPVDSARDPLVVSLHLMEGAMAMSSCNGRPDRTSMMRDRYPIDVPTLTPPAGGRSLGGGSNWGDNKGQLTSTVITTVTTEQLLTHYTGQLTPAWKTEGKPSLADRVAVQRFSFTKGQEKWTASLVIVSNGDSHEVTIHFSRTSF